MPGASPPSFRVRPHSYFRANTFSKLHGHGRPRSLSEACYSMFWSWAARRAQPGEFTQGISSTTSSNGTGGTHCRHHHADPGRRCGGHAVFVAGWRSPLWVRGFTGRVVRLRNYVEAADRLSEDGKFRFPRRTARSLERSAGARAFEGGSTSAVRAVAGAKA